MIDPDGIGMGRRVDPACPVSVPIVLNAVDRSRAIMELLSVGGFADTPALARWAETAEAQPILRGYLAARLKPADGEYFAIDFDAAAGEIAARETLAADIEARFGR